MDTYTDTNPVFLMYSFIPMYTESGKTSTMIMTSPHHGNGPTE